LFQESLPVETPPVTQSHPYGDINAAETAKRFIRSRVIEASISSHAFMPGWINDNDNTDTGGIDAL
jgi:hypothetical protein